MKQKKSDQTGIKSSFIYPIDDLAPRLSPKIAPAAVRSSQTLDFKEFTTRQP